MSLLIKAIICLIGVVITWWFKRCKQHDWEWMHGLGGVNRRCRKCGRKE